MRKSASNNLILNIILSGEEKWDFVEKAFFIFIIF